MGDPSSTLPPAHSSLPLFLSHQTEGFLLSKMPHTSEVKRWGKGGRGVPRATRGGQQPLPTPDPWGEGGSLSSPCSPTLHTPLPGPSPAPLLLLADTLELVDQEDFVLPLLEMPEHSSSASHVHPEVAGSSLHSEGALKDVTP